jgi:competence protein ComEA
MKRFAALSIAGIAGVFPAWATVNVNTAQQSELQATRGLDKLKAKSIIEYRNAHGPYRSLDDLEKALGEPVTGKIAPQVAFDGPPYIGPPKPAKGKKKKSKS